MATIDSLSSLKRRLAAGLLVTLLLGAVAFGADSACPKCGAPLPAGARFCTQCGARIEGESAAAAPAASNAGPKASVVQVIAIHDREISSLVEAIGWGGSIRIDSLLGSGFAISPGEFVTDASLLAGAREVRLTDTSGRSTTGRVVGVDPLIGIGLVTAELLEVPPIPRRSGESIREGEPLIAIGFSSVSGMTASVTTSPGVVSGRNRSGMEIHPVEDYLQSDASLPRGFAGGPGIDSAGGLVGMSTAFPLGRSLVLGPTTGIGYFIPVEWIDRGVAWIRAGQPVRPWIGAHVVAADPESRRLFGLPGTVRWVVEDVFPDSPAAGNLRRGDGLLRAFDAEISSLADVQLRLLSLKPGDPVPLEVLRGDKKLSLPLVVQARAERPRLKGVDALRLYGGVEIGTGTQPGLVVTRVLPGSNARSAKISNGDVLVSLFTKKDLEKVEKSDARWRGVRDLPELEEQIGRAYADLDFFIGLKFRCRDGEKRTLFLFSLLTATDAL